MFGPIWRKKPTNMYCFRGRKGRILTQLYFGCGKFWLKFKDFRSYGVEQIFIFGCTNFGPNFGISEVGESRQNFSPQFFGARSKSLKLKAFWGPQVEWNFLPQEILKTWCEILTNDNFGSIRVLGIIYKSKISASIIWRFQKWCFWWPSPLWRVTSK